MATQSTDSSRSAARQPSVMEDVLTASIKGQPSEPGASSELGSAEFTFGTVYPRQRANDLLRPGMNLAAGERHAVPFWWDKDANVLVNPTRVPFDPNIKPGDYQLSASLLNFRASHSTLGDVWEKLSNNAQLNINAGSVSSEGDTLDWILMSAINIAENTFKGKDGQLASLTQNNKPTDTLKPAEAVRFKKGVCTLGVTINVQRKRSVWDKLLSALHTFTGSAVFGILPIPKLYETAIKSVVSTLRALEENSNLVPVLQGNAFEYKLYDGANVNADFTMRSGKWVIVDSMFATAHMDRSTRNLNGVYLDIPGMQYELRDANDRPVDTTYTVLDLELMNVAMPASGS